jgi:Mpv17 / PMP22 family
MIQRISMLVLHLLVWLSAAGGAWSFQLHRRPRGPPRPDHRHEVKWALLPSDSSFSSAWTRSIIRIRGGELPHEPRKNGGDFVDDDSPTPRSDLDLGVVDNRHSPATCTATGTSFIAASGISSLVKSACIPVKQLVQSYSATLVAYPILTKSLTAGVVFVLADYLAQCLQRIKTQPSSSKNLSKKPGNTNWTRVWANGAVGLLYFGPASHAWVDLMFWLFPGTSLFSNLQKAAAGVMVFGPSFTCLFFAVNLMQARAFNFGRWLQKIRRDLPGAMVAEIGFWPTVDLISFSLIPPIWIPFFMNICTLLWTIYLSILSNQ